MVTARGQKLIAESLKNPRVTTKSEQIEFNRLNTVEQHKRQIDLKKMFDILLTKYLKLEAELGTMKRQQNHRVINHHIIEFRAVHRG